MNSGRLQTRMVSTPRLFTLVELLVIVAIIVVLAALLFPALARARWNAKNVVCMSNLRQIAVGFTTYAADYNSYWPFRPEEPNYELWNSVTFNNFQRGEIGDQPYPQGFANSNIWVNGYPQGGWSLVQLVAPYFGYKREYGNPYRQTVMYNGDALGPTFVCSLYKPNIGYSPVPGWNGRSKHGTHEHGLADTNGGGNDVHFMSYNYYPNGGSWRECHYGSRKVGEPITFGIQWGSGWNNPLISNSTILFGDLIIGSSNAGDPVKALHQPYPATESEYITDANHLSRINEHFTFLGKFRQNNVYQDGSAFSLEGDSYNIAETHVQINSGDLIPRE